MKYIRHYEEDIKYNYKKGDYIILNMENIKKENSKNNFVKLPPSDCALLILDNRNMSYPYLVEFFNGESLAIKPYEILRPATTEEIEKFEIQKNSNKYNL